MARFTGLIGILVILALCWLASTSRRRIRWKTVAWGIALQILFAAVVLRTYFGQQAMAWAGGVVKSALDCTFAGTGMVFGALGIPTGSFGTPNSAESNSPLSFSCVLVAR